jgi:predicted nucleotidyltransferase
VSALEDSLRRSVADLESAGARFALVGGMAVSARTEPRFTRDVDMAVSLDDDAAAEALVRDLSARGFAASTVVEQEARGRLAQVRLVPPGASPGGCILDLLFASSGIEPEIVREAETLEILPGLRVPVARTGHLIALKVLSHDDSIRPQDRVDLAALLRCAAPDERLRARQGLRLIAERGFGRGRDLEALADTFLGARTP